MGRYALRRRPCASARRQGARAPPAPLRASEPLRPADPPSLARFARARRLRQVVNLLSLGRGPGRGLRRIATPVPDCNAPR
eukprot:13778406-Alexandrium_andersonii.AAC.1